MSKYLFLFLVLIIFKLDVKAQPFGANNATWHFNSYNYFFPPFSISPIKISSSPSFLFNGYSCRTLSISPPVTCTADSNYIVRESNDSVYYYLTGSNQFVMLYDYNAAIGDTHTIYGTDITGSDTSVQMVVTAVGTTIINGSLKRTYNITNLTSTSYFDFGGTVIEDIGSTFFLFPQWGFCDPIIHELRCYEDSIIGLYQLSNISCDSIIWLSSTPEFENNEFIISPNPFNSEISITIINKAIKNLTLSLFDFSGKQLWECQEATVRDSFTKVMDLSKFSKGIYFLVFDIDGQKQVKKIVKE